jgi:hypothetical protein
MNNNVNNQLREAWYRIFIFFQDVSGPYNFQQPLGNIGVRSESRDRATRTLSLLIH